MTKKNFFSIFFIFFSQDTSFEDDGTDSAALTKDQQRRVIELIEHYDENAVDSQHHLWQTHQQKMLAYEQKLEDARQKMDELRRKIHPISQWELQAVDMESGPAEPVEESSSTVILCSSKTETNQQGRCSVIAHGSKIVGENWVPSPDSLFSPISSPADDLAEMESDARDEL